MSPNAGEGGGGDAGSQPMSTAGHMEPKKTLEITSTFNLWQIGTAAAQWVRLQTFSKTFRVANTLKPANQIGKTTNCVHEERFLLYG